jgi:hypothetical protein
MRLRTARWWRRFVDPVRRRRAARRILPPRAAAPRAARWRRSRRTVVTSVVTIIGALLLLSWLGRAFVVVVIEHEPVVFPPRFDPDTACRRTGVSCGALTGFVVTWLSVAAAFAVFLLFRFRSVLRPYQRRAKTKASELVPTAGGIVGEVVGREELCEVIIDDLRNSDDRRPHVLLGGVGTGKTAVLVRLTRLLAKGGATPVPVRLRDVQSGDLDFHDLAWKKFKLEVDRTLLAQGEADKAWRQLRRRDRIVVLADGLEEAFSGDEVQDRDNQIRIAIRRARRDKLPLVIASRPHDALRGVDAAIFELEPLSGSASLDYLRRHGATGDRQRLDWIVETAEIAEAPLYLRITRELHERGLLHHLTDGARARGVNTRSLDRSALRLNLLDTWLEALIDGHLQADLPFTQEERLSTVACVSALAVVGLELDSLEVRYDQVVQLDGRGQEVFKDTSLGAALSLLVENKRIRSTQIRLAATWATRLGLLEARAQGVRFQHSILQAYLGSLLLDSVVTREDDSAIAGKDDSAVTSKDFATANFRRAGKPARELLIALVLMSRRRRGPDVSAGGLSSDNPLTAAPAVPAETMPKVVTMLIDETVDRWDNKALDMIAAAFEIDSVNPDPRHQDIAGRVHDEWTKFAASDARTLEEAKLGVVYRFGDAARQIQRDWGRKDGTVRACFQALFEIGCIEDSSYAVRRAVAQQLGISGQGAFKALETKLSEGLDWNWAKDRTPEQEEEAWRKSIMCAWITPLLLGSVDAETRPAGESNLRRWVEHVGVSESGKRMPLSVEIALAQGFTYAANRRRRHPYAHTEARSFLVEQATDLLKRSGFWAAQLTLLHALTLWALPDDGMVDPDAGEARRRDRRRERAQEEQRDTQKKPAPPSPDPRTRVAHWLDIAGSERDTRLDADRESSGDGKHPFVREAADLAVYALESRQPERFIWVDVFGVTSKIGSRSTGQGELRKHNLWIPPSVGWSALDPRAQKLVADVLLLGNLADRGRRPTQREQRLRRANRHDLPPCLKGSRDPLDPNRAVGGAQNSEPGANCAGGCRFELCPYPPKGVQSYRAEISEAFCRRQHTLLGRQWGRRRSASWQGALPDELQRFWNDMARRARR